MAEIFDWATDPDLAAISALEQAMVDVLRRLLPHTASVLGERGLQTWASELAAVARPFALAEMLTALNHLARDHDQ